MGRAAFFGRGWVMSLRILGRRLLARGSLRPGRLPTLSVN